MGGGLGIHVLGPFEVERDGRPIALGSFKQRSLLAILVIHRNQVVSTDRLIDELWGGADGHDHQNALWAHVSNLRKALEPDADDRTTGVVTTTSPGYVLRLDDEALDAAVFEHRVAEGRALVDIDAAAASIVLGEALAMWRGPPLEDFAYESWAQPEIARLDELRLEAVELRVAAELRAGRRGELVAELEAWSDSTPRASR